MNKFMQTAINEAKKAAKKDDVPVGAVIVKDGKIISRGYNKKNSKQISTKHAEIIAIEKACKKLKSWHLDKCEIYVTLEPCAMCFGAIEESRIKKIVYGISNDKYGYFNKKSKDTKIDVVKTDNEEILKLMHKFFIKKRK